MLHAFTMRRYLELMQARGFAPADVLAGTGIDAERIADKGYVIRPAQRQAVIANMLRLTGNSALGLEFGRDIRIAQLGVVGHVLLSSHSIWEQYRLWLKLAGPLLGIECSVSLRVDDGSGWTCEFREPMPPGPEHVFCLEELLMISGRIAQTLNGETMDISVLRLDYPPPPHAHLYADAFRCPVEFGAPVAEFRVTRPTANEVFGGPDDEFAAACRAYSDRLLQEISSHQTLANRLRDALLSRLPDVPTIEEAAKTLGVSARTLRRRLSEEGTGFKEVVNDLRRDMAIEYLRSQRLKPKEIGYRLGFNFTSDFRRAFRSWTGRSITQFVDELEQGRAPV